MIDQKLFSLNYIDDGIRKLNLRTFDGDKPSTLIGVSLTSCDSNLHQHGMITNTCTPCTVKPMQAELHTVAS